MNRRVVVTLGGLVGSGAALVYLVDRTSPWPALLALGFGVVLGELITLRPPGREPLPVSFAILLVVIRIATAPQAIATVAGAELVAAALRAGSGQSRLWYLVRRLAAAAAGYTVYDAVFRATADASFTVQSLTALAAAGTAMLVADEILGAISTRRPPSPVWRSADVAVVVSGMLMALGFDGLDGEGGIGLWAPLLFSVPLLGLWYSFRQLAGVQVTYDQTVRALSLVPELGGKASAGHAERVTSVALAIGRELGLSREEMRQLEIAARLHDLGALCLDDPGVRGKEIGDHEVAETTAAMLQSTQTLVGAGDIVFAETLPHRQDLDAPAVRGLPAGQALKAAIAFDRAFEKRKGDVRAAVDEVHREPASEFDPRVLQALDDVAVPVLARAR